MAVGFGLLRLSSAQFWVMTPREIERAMYFLRGAPATGPDRGAFAALMAAFPDKPMETGHG